MKDWSFCFLSALTWLGVFTCGAAAETPASIKSLEHSLSTTEKLSDVHVRRTSLRQLSGLNSLSLRGTDGSASVAFGGRADELVTKAVLRLRYSHSPALLLAQSHLRVLLNEETAGIIPFMEQTLARTNEQVIELDPRFISDLNQLRFQFIGHYTTSCEDLLNSSLWAEVSGASELELTTRPITVPNELALLPEPFFDRRDLERLQLSFVFPLDPSLEMVRISGIASSWFGQLAGWRGARFPVSIDKPVQGHAVVFATNTHYPKFLEQQIPVAGPVLRIVSNPLDGHSKLLLALGRDDADLHIAIEGLVRGSATLSGSEATIRAVAQTAPHSAYDAPGWIRADRPTKLGELVEHTSELRALGHTPALIRVELRVPPDLFMWRSPGVPLDLQYRHTAITTADAGTSSLTVSVNGELLRSFELAPNSGEGTLMRMRAMFLETREQLGHRETEIPPFTLGSRSELQFAFNFPVPKIGTCRDTYVQNIGGSIDPNSSIDFSGFRHFAALPNLGYFATSGFPFTRYADLSQTIVILPSIPDVHEIETFLTLMGRMGEVTGLPATAVRLYPPPSDPAQYRDADLLMIGATEHLKLLDQWKTSLPVLAQGSNRKAPSIRRSLTSLRDILGFEANPDPSSDARSAVDSAESLAAFIGFESPITPKRSVVLVTADATKSLSAALDSLEDVGLVRAMRGSIVLMHAKKVDSYLTGKPYVVDDLPIWTWLWYRAADYPLVMVVLALAGVLLFTLLSWQGLRRIARHRLDGAT